MKLTNLRTILIAGSLLFFSFPLPGQLKHVSFQRYSTEEGLSDPTVTSLAQDSFGYIWIATEDGLSRFDGYTFTIYRHNPADSSSITSGEIRGIAGDDLGSLWIATSDGLDRYDYARDRFAHFRHSDLDTTSIGSNTLSAITVDRRNNLWVGSADGGLNLVDPKTGAVRRFRHDPNNLSSIGNDSIRFIYAARNGKIWISYYASGFSILDPDNHAFTNFQSAVPEDLQFTQTQITSICEDREGKYWLATSGAGLIRIDESLHTAVHYRHDPEDADTYGDTVSTVIRSDSRGNLWIGNFNGGVDQFDFSNNRFVHYQHIPSDPSSIGSGKVNALFEDRAGSVWIGTWRGGVSAVHPFERKFEHLLHVDGDTNSLSENMVLSVCEARHGEVWIGTDSGGIDRYDPAANIITHYRYDPAKGKSYGSVRTILEDDLGEVWVGTIGGGLAKFDRKHEKFVRFAVKPSVEGGMVSNDVTSLFEDADGELWIGAGDGMVNHLDQSSGTFRQIDFEDSSKSERSGIQTIVQDRNGDVWIATVKSGIFRYNKSMHTFQHYLHDETDPQSKFEINSIAMDDSGTIWVGKSGGGLGRFDAVNNHFEHLKGGLPGNFVKGIVPDHNGNLWLSTNTGLSKFDTRSRIVRNYDSDDGVQGIEFHAGSCARGKSGRIYFGGTNGMNLFYPDSVHDNPTIPPVVIGSVRVLDKPMQLPSAISEDGELQLSYRDDYFSFDFAALNFTSPKKNEYAYKLEGLDKEWINAGTRRFASYTHLEGGEYIFRVKGSNNDGLWNESGASVRVKIYSPYWERWWVRLILVMVIAGVPLIIYRYRFRKLLELERSRNRIVHELRDEVSATLSGINYFTEAINQGIQQKQERRVQKYLSLILESAGSVQDSVADILWSVNSDHDGWEQLFEKFRRFASDLLENKPIRNAIEMPERVSLKQLSIERRRNFWLLYKEIVTIVVRHSESSTIAIRIRVTGDRKLSLVIAGDGKGLDASIAPGMSVPPNIQALAVALHGTLELESSPGGGTTWKFIFPAG